MKLVLISGAMGGIGQSICEYFHQKNFFVVGTGRKNIKSSDYQFLDDYIKCDLTNPEDIENMMVYLNDTYNTIDCIVNNAAYQVCKPIYKYTEDDWDKTYGCNIKSIFLILKHGIKQISESKTSIINIGSVHSVATSANIAGYASTKSALVGLTKNMAIDMAKYGVRVNCVSPGAVNTKMLSDGLKRGHVGSGTADSLVKKLGESHLLGRVGEPGEIAKFIYDVHDNEFINGANLLIDGGASIKLSTE
jgi:NAD(P)-dependent dehydrogenase (short-subunit alcohol dehydrogenase family)